MEDFLFFPFIYFYQYKLIGICFILRFIIQQNLTDFPSIDIGKLSELAHVSCCHTTIMVIFWWGREDFFNFQDYKLLQLYLYNFYLNNTIYSYISKQHFYFLKKGFRKQMGFCFQKGFRCACYYRDVIVSRLFQPMKKRNMCVLSLIHI